MKIYAVGLKLHLLFYVWFRGRGLWFSAAVVVVLSGCRSLVVVVVVVVRPLGGRCGCGR